jgi:hypothetical protein
MPCRTRSVSVAEDTALALSRMPARGPENTLIELFAVVADDNENQATLSLTERPIGACDPQRLGAVDGEGCAQLGASRPNLCARARAAAAMPRAQRRSRPGPASQSMPACKPMQLTLAPTELGALSVN